MYYVENDDDDDDGSQQSVMEHHATRSDTFTIHDRVYTGITVRTNERTDASRERRPQRELSAKRRVTLLPDRDYYCVWHS